MVSELMYMNGNKILFVQLALNNKNGKRCDFVLRNVELTHLPFWAILKAQRPY